MTSDTLERAVADAHLGRHSVWGAEVIRADGVTLTPAVTGGRMFWNMDSDSIAGGSLTTTTDLGDLVGAIIKPHITVNGALFRFGPYYATADPAHLTSTGPVWTIEYIDPTVRLSIATLQQPLSIPRGAHVVRTARQHLEQLGLRVAIPDSDITLRVAMGFDRHTSWMEAITKLLSAAQLSKVRARPEGLVVERLLAPDELPGDTWRLEEGPESAQVLNYRTDSNHLAIANRLQVETRGDATATPLIGYARDENTTRWSHAKRGYWVDVPRAIITEVTTQDAANQVARRELSELMTKAETLTVEHAWHPDISVGTVGQFTSTRYPQRTGTWQVASQQLPMQATALATTTLRRVVGL